MDVTTGLTSVRADFASLADAADQLGVHYMTAYRYVRTGRLPAVKRGGQWWVEPEDIQAFLASVAGDAVAVKDVPSAKKNPGARVNRRRYATQLRRRAVVGDDIGSWAVVTEALASGATVSQIHTEVIAPALEQIGERWACGDLSVAEEHQAITVVERLLGRMTPMFRHAGRTRATIVVGVVAGDPHALPAALMTDLLHDRNFAVINLGANTPTISFLDVLAAVDGPVAVGLCGVSDGSADAMRDTARELAQARPDILVLLGGPVAGRVGPTLDGAHWSTSTDQALQFFEDFRSSCE